MKVFEYVIQDALGIHARPAGILAKEAKNYESTIKIKKGDKEAEATRLMSVMGLGVKKGETIAVTVEGADEEAAFAAMQKFFEEQL